MTTTTLMMITAPVVIVFALLFTSALLLLGSGKKKTVDEPRGAAKTVSVDNTTTTTAPTLTQTTTEAPAPEKKKKTSTFWKTAWIYTRNTGIAIMLIGIIAIIAYTFPSWKKMPFYQTHAIGVQASQPKEWIFSQERSHDARNWQPNDDQTSEKAVIRRMDEDNLEFTVSSYNKVAKRVVSSHYVGKRTKELGRHYVGTYTQYKTPVSPEIHQTWTLEQTTADRFAGHRTGLDGSENNAYLERK